MARDEGDRKARAILPIVGAGAIAALLLLLRRRVASDPDKATLYGKVRDADTNHPIQGINVACNGYTGETNASGDYRIINIEPGTYDVLFTDPLERYEPLVV